MHSNRNTRPSYVIVIPIYNEELSIKDTMDFLRNFRFQHKYLFVDDGSTDKSVEIVSEYLGNLDANLLTFDRNQGYGKACIEGGKWAANNDYEWVLFADSDLTNNFNEVDNFVNVMNEENYCIKGSRFLQKNSLSSLSNKRKVWTIAGRYIARLFFLGMADDPTNGFRAIRTQFYLSHNFQSNDFSLILEEMYRISKNRFKVVNVSVTLTERSPNQRDSSFHYSPLQIWNYFKWCLLNIMPITKRV